MTIPMMQWGMDPVYTQVSHRLRTKYNINLAEHVASMNVIHKKVQEGFWFTPKDHKRLAAALCATKAFEHDNRMNHFSAAAASQTSGEGYREISETSIHCQLSAATVNMHIDLTGYMWRGPNGEQMIGPDAPFHILDELKWPDLIKWISSKNKWAGKIAERTHPITPNLKNKFMPQIGLRGDIVRGNSFDFSKQWSLTLDFRYGCTDYACNRTEVYTGLNFEFRH